MPANHYSTLQVHTDAEQEIIEAAYKTLARKYHPDINRTTDANLRMQQINEAYEVLADREKRTLYDQDNLHKVSDADDLPGQLELAKNQLLDEQLSREALEEELASICQKLRIEQLKLKRAERKSVRLAEQLKESPPKIRHTRPPSSDAAAGKSAQLLLQRKYQLAEKKLAGEQLNNKLLQEELSILSGRLSEERTERENATRGLSRLEHLLAAERQRREKCEEKMRLAEYDRQAEEKVSALRGVGQARKSEEEKRKKEGKTKR